MLKKISEKCPIKIINREIIYSDEDLEDKKNSGYEINEAEVTNEHEIEYDLKLIFENNPNIIYNTIQYSKTNNKLILYTNQKLNLKVLNPDLNVTNFENEDKLISALTSIKDYIDNENPTVIKLSRIMEVYENIIKLYNKIIEDTKLEMENSCSTGNFDYMKFEVITDEYIKMEVSDTIYTNDHFWKFCVYKKDNNNLAVKNLNGTNINKYTIDRFVKDRNYILLDTFEKIKLLSKYKKLLENIKKSITFIVNYMKINLKVRIEHSYYDLDETYSFEIDEETKFELFIESSSRKINSKVKAKTKRQVEYLKENGEKILYNLYIPIKYLPEDIQDELYEKRERQLKQKSLLDNIHVNPNISEYDFLIENIKNNNILKNEFLINEVEKIISNYSDRLNEYEKNMNAIHLEINGFDYELEYKLMIENIKKLYQKYILDNKELIDLYINLNVCMDALNGKTIIKNSELIEMFISIKEVSKIIDESTIEYEKLLEKYINILKNYLISNCDNKIENNVEIELRKELHKLLLDLNKKSLSYNFYTKVNENIKYFVDYNYNLNNTKLSYYLVKEIGKIINEIGNHNLTENDYSLIEKAFKFNLSHQKLEHNYASLYNKNDKIVESMSKILLKISENKKNNLIDDTRYKNNLIALFNILEFLCDKYCISKENIINEKGDVICNDENIYEKINYIISELNKCDIKNNKLEKNDTQKEDKNIIECLLNYNSNFIKLDDKYSLLFNKNGKIKETISQILLKISEDRKNKLIDDNQFVNNLIGLFNILELSLLYIKENEEKKQKIKKYKLLSHLK